MHACAVAATRALVFPGIGATTTVVHPVEFSPGG
ncbi:uncharacterized protein SOCEGT47_051390 [Sorangium cellulosum]|uniref:Uncharacterized protein n=1 Tax=Sorangium cellulosum TaxID=56 RepID=A0A4P2Q5D6_SORCE|nr:uncharacterized protein SOCEGT47_051390 [Sorangium cellulosum]